ncbi:MAG: hypothetical protein U1F34_03965 [Gammaproteobacteria bacterium]
MIISMTAAASSVMSMVLLKNSAATNDCSVNAKASARHAGQEIPERYCRHVYQFYLRIE